MNIFEWIAEDKIRSAIESGEWDHLPGKGKPLQWKENPYEPPEWRMAFSLLRNQGFSLPWMEERKEIEQEIEALRARAAQACASGDSSAIKVWLEQQIHSLNRRIFRYNLEVPSVHFQLMPLNVEKELNRPENSD